MAIRGLGCRLRNGVSAAALALCCSAAMASLESDAARLLASLPARADAIVVVNDAARLRATPAGRGLIRALEDSGSMVRTGRAWGELATRLGWTSERAFDEILGRRVTVVVRDGEAGAGHEWALLTQVTRETERRLRERLSGVPRGCIAGLVVLGVEDGAYEIAVGAPSAGATGPLVTVLLGPRQSRLFDELAPALNAHAASTRPRPGSPDILAAVRDRAAGGEHHVLVSARNTGGAWEATVLLDGESLGVTPGMAQAWSDAAFQRMERGSLLAVMTAAEGLAVPGMPGIAGIDRIGAILTLNRGESDITRTALVVRPAERGAGHEHSLAGGGTYFPEYDGTGGPRGQGRLSFSYAVKTTDTRRMMLEGDQRVAALLASMQTGRALASTARLEMTIPGDDARGLRLDEVMQDNPEDLERLTASFGPHPTLRWGVCSGGQLCGDWQIAGPGWWSATLAPAGSAAADLTAQALAWPDASGGKPRLSIGVVRPAALLRSAGAFGGEMLGELRPLESVEQLRWDAWVRPDGSVQCDLNIQMAD